MHLRAMKSTSSRVNLQFSVVEVSDETAVLADHEKERKRIDRFPILESVGLGYQLPRTKDKKTELFVIP
jgi:hypothetical protein